MRRSATLDLLRFILLALLLPRFAWGQHAGVPGPGPVASAPDFPASSALSDEEPQPLNEAFTLRASFEGVASPPGWWHPDDNIAVGPRSVLLVANYTLTLRDKSGALIASMSTTDFFRTVRVPGEGVEIHVCSSTRAASASSTWLTGQ